MEDEQIDQMLMGAEQMLAQGVRPMPMMPQASPSVDPQQIVRLVDQRVAQTLSTIPPLPGPRGESGQGLNMQEVVALVEQTVAKIPPPKDGKDGKDGEDGKPGVHIRERVIKMPDYELLANPDGASRVGFRQAGSGAVSRTVEQELRETISPLQFSSAARVEGTTNDSAAILAASVAAVAQGKDVDFGGHTWIVGTQLALTSSHNGLRWRLRGATIKKGFSGDMVTLTATSNFSIDGVGVIDGQHGTYTGKGFVFSGASPYPFFAPGINFTSFTDSHIEFGADAGQRAKIYSHFLPGTGQTDHRTVHCTGTDTSAMYRFIQNSVMPGGYIDLDAAQNTIIGDSAFRRVEIDSNCSVTGVQNCVWGNLDAAMTISGSHNIIAGNRFSGNVTLDANFSGIFAIPRFTTGKLINNSAVAVVFDRQPIAVIASTGSTASVSATTNEEALATIDIPGGLLRANDAIRVTTYWLITSSVNNKTLRMYVADDGVGLSGTAGASHVLTTSNTAKLEMLVQNINSTSLQRLFSDVTRGGTTTGSEVTNATSSTIDTTEDWEVVISGQKASSGETLTLLTYKVELVRAP